MKLSRLLPALVLSLTSLAAPAMADLPGKHPALLHGLTDLRNARWYLNHQAGDAKVYADEDVAIQELDAAIADMKKAAIDDGKDVNDHPKGDVPEHGSRLLKSIESLDGAKRDVSGEEDNPYTRDLKARSLVHIQKAHDAAVRAHSAWLKDMGK